MCGIIGKIGDEALSYLVEGLKRLSYRGMDATGIGFIANKQLKIFRNVGKSRIDDLQNNIKGYLSSCTLAIAHGRWATNGDPDDLNNAHPQVSGDIALVHNGIIENYRELKAMLVKENYYFESDTDTEAFVHLIHFEKMKDKCSLEVAIYQAIQLVTGTYAIAVICAEEPEKIVLARKGSDLYYAKTKNATYFCSDNAAFPSEVKHFQTVEDGTMVICTQSNINVLNSTNFKKQKPGEAVPIENSQVEHSKGEYPHFMLKEIHEQPTVVMNCLAGRINFADSTISLQGIGTYTERILRAKSITIAACGTSYHAALVAKQLFQELAGIRVFVELAPEFTHSNPNITEDDIVIVISQSGTTTDTLDALRYAKLRGALTIGITNRPGSSVAMETDCGLYIHAGLEKSVASTKAFTCQVTALTLIALFLGQESGYLKESERIKIIDELHNLPEKIKRIIDQSDEIQRIAETLKETTGLMFLGKNYNFPVALEGSLKLKEISYIHSDAQSAMEMKHGPLALVNENYPVLFLIPRDRHYSFVKNTLELVHSRKGRTIAITNEGADEVLKIAKEHIIIPSTIECLYPLLTVIPLQLFAYYSSVIRGIDPDEPRNLAKSITTH